jgi:hypothetical protein
MLASPVSSLEGYSTTAAINAAIDRFRKLFPDAGRSVRIKLDGAEGHGADRHSFLSHPIGVADETTAALQMRDQWCDRSNKPSGG